MKKSTIIVIVVVIIAIIAVVAIFSGKRENEEQPGKAQDSKLSPINGVEDLNNLINEVYTGAGIDVSGLETRDVDLTDAVLVKSYTGLESAESFEYVSVSEPLINASAYSLVVAKVKDGVNANEVAKQMSENVDTRKWICVGAEKLYATNSGNVVFLIMTDEDKAKAVYDSFKNLAGTVGQEYERTTEDGELPPDTPPITQTPEQ